MRIKKNKAIYICQFNPNTLMVVKCLLANNHKREFTGFETAAISQDSDEKNLAEKLSGALKKLKYNDDPVIISLPRSKAICRWLKVPTQIPEEIEKIVALQAPRYLPYPNEELITGYQAISTDKDGYAQINLVIAHKDVVEHYLKILKMLKIANVTIALSSYGAVNFFDYLLPEESKPLMLIDIDREQAELSVIAQKKLIFSRYFRINSGPPLWENLFIEEIRKTQEAYFKETAQKAPVKIILTGSVGIYPGFAENLRQQVDLPVDVLDYKKIDAAADLLNNISGSEYSYVSLLGLGLKSLEPNLNLLPRGIKEKNKILLKNKERLGLGMLFFAIILLLFLGRTKNLDNKANYLRELNLELNKLTQDARVLEKIEKKLQYMRQSTGEKISALDLIYQLHQVIPEQISLITLSCDERNQIVLRGQTPELNAVFNLVTQLEKAPVFNGFHIEVRYATQKKTPTGQIVDFEIGCSKQ